MPRLRVFAAFCVAALPFWAALTFVPRPAYSREAQTKTVSGKISAIGDASFTLDVKRDQNVQSMQFLIDDATRFDGKLELGAPATVQFKTADGNNIAVHITVRAAGRIG
jgi:hypothetical protein